MLFLITTILIFSITYCVLYLALLWIISEKWPNFTPRSIYSLVLLAALNVLLFALYLFIPSEFWGNRIQHAIGGGMLAFFMFWLVIRDTQTHLTRLQFFTLGFLVVTALGVANELLEFVAQHYTSIIFAGSIYDTWWDLLSNTAGACVGGLLFSAIGTQIEKLIR